MPRGRTFAADLFDGIFGLSLGGEPGGFFQTLVNQGYPGDSMPSCRCSYLLTNLLAIFSFYLTHRDKPQAELTLGGIDNTKFTGSITYSPLILPGYWGLNSTGVFVNGKTSSELEKPIQPYIDSGLSNLSFNKKQAEVYFEKAPLTDLSTHVQTIGNLCIDFARHKTIRSRAWSVRDSL
jgi:hypothetical protein